MAVGDKQRLIIEIMQEVLQEPAQINISFNWLNNKHLPEDFGIYYDNIEIIFDALNGDKSGMDNKSGRVLKPDCYFGGEYNFIFEFDELQHFTTYKKIVLQNYPTDLEYGFNLPQYIRYCDNYSREALKKGPAGYRKPKDEFPFENGRAAQRAFFDAFRDILPTLHGLNPTLRISEFEVRQIIIPDDNAKRIVKDILISRGII